MVQEMCGVWLKDRNREMDLMQMLSSNDIIDQFAIASSVH